MRLLMRNVVVAVAAVLTTGLSPAALQQEKPFLTSELLFPLEHWHNHGSTVVELSNGDLLTCWFHGSGERTADDVVVRGARLAKGARTWSAPFLMADTPGYPDTNSTMFVDPKQRLWLLWPTILANEWQTALMKYKIASSFDNAGKPQWAVSEVLHVTPGDEFARTVNAEVDRMIASGEVESAVDGAERGRTYLERLRKDAANKLTRRLGWMTRAHPYVLDNSRLIVPLYSDGFNFSLMAITDDGARPGEPVRHSSGWGTCSRRSRARKTGRSSPTCATTDRRPSASWSVGRQTAARRGAASRIPIV